MILAPSETLRSGRLGKELKLVKKSRGPSFRGAAGDESLRCFEGRNQTPPSGFRVTRGRVIHAGTLLRISLSDGYFRNGPFSGNICASFG
jgi:hypothetical protein